MTNLSISLLRGLSTVCIIGLGIWGGLFPETGPNCLNLEFTFSFIALGLSQLYKPTISPRKIIKQTKPLWFLIFLFNVLTWVPTTPITDTVATFFWYLIIILFSISTIKMLLNRYNLQEVLNHNVFYLSMFMYPLVCGGMATYNYALDYIIISWVIITMFTLLIATAIGYILLFIIKLFQISKYLRKRKIPR